MPTHDRNACANDVFLNAVGRCRLRGYVLFSGDSLAAKEFFERRTVDFDVVSRDRVELVVIGHPAKCGPRYKEYRGEAQRRQDEREIEEYRRGVEACGGDEDLYILQETNDLAEELGVGRTLLPCVAFALEDSPRDNVIVSFDPGWFENPGSSRVVHRALCRWMESDTLRDLLARRLDPRRLCEELAPQLEHVRRSISRGIRAGGASPRPRAQGACPLPAGVGWKDLSLTVCEETLIVEYKRQREMLYRSDIGFETTGGSPTRLWTFLRALGALAGVLQPSVSAGGLPKDLRKPVSDLRRILREIFLLDDDPFHPSRGAIYRTRFKVYAPGLLRCPIPSGSWDALTITVFGIERVRFTVDEPQRTAAFKSGRGDGSSRRTVAETIGTCAREYSFQLLDLVDTDGRLNSGGQLLLEFAEGKGQVNRPKDDQAIISLGEFLQQFTEVERFPFDYRPTEGEWVAKFEIGGVTRSAL
jgi:hypothetical protein